MEQARIDEFKKRLNEVQVMAQAISRELGEEAVSIKASYFDLDGHDAHEVSLCGVRKALSRVEKLTMRMVALHNIDRVIAANEREIC